MAVLAMAMRTMKSGIGTNPARLTSQIGELKAKQDNATARMGSDLVGAIGTADPDFYGFVTAPFREMKPVTVQSGSGIYSTLAILPDSQHATPEDRYYSPSMPFAMDRAGSATIGLNILRSGPPPAGYYGGQKLMVQNRVKRFFKPDPGDGSFCYIWDVAGVKSVPADYTLQADERLDGGFFPGSIYLGVERPYGWTFPTGANGRLLYNSDPFTAAGWSGALNTVPDNSSTRPVVTAISPTSYVLGSSPGTLTITGSNFTDCGFALVGPFKPVVTVTAARPPLTIDGGIVSGTQETTLVYYDWDGAYYYRAVVSDTSITVAIPGPDWVAGTYGIVVIGNDGQIGKLDNALSVTEAP